MAIFNYPFATSGDRNTSLPTTTDPNGFVSFQSGWTADYEVLPSLGGKLVQRRDINQVFYKICEGVNTLETNMNAAIGGITKQSLGLGNVNNTSDLAKPISTATQNALNLKRNITDSYSKAQTNTLLNAKRDITDSYSKAETDTLLNLKRNISDSYSKAQTNTLLNAKTNYTDFASSATQNGYTELPNGLILVWGVYTTLSNLDEDITITLPKAFPTACLNVSLTNYLPTAGIGNDIGYHFVSSTTTTITIHRDQYGSALSPTGCMYFVIGH